MPSATQAAAEYVEAMNAGDIERMMALFAPEAMMRHPMGVYADPASIRDFFLEVAFANAAHLERIELQSQGSTAWLEVEATSDVTPGRQRVVDVFRVDPKGRITDLGVYSGNIVPGSHAQG